MDALLVIDVQKALVEGAYRKDEVLNVIGAMCEKVRNRGGLVVYIQHCHRSFEPMKRGHSGWELHEALNVKEEDLVLEKEASDSFYATALDEVLRERGVERVYITGLQTEFCVDATARSALSRGYRVTLIADGHTTGDAVLPAEKIVEHHNAVLANLAHPTNSIQVLSSAEV